MITSPTIMPGAEPYFQRGGGIGCLCLHGFTASPAEVIWLAKHLAEQGHTVYVPRMAGHGTTPQNLARTHWTDWYTSALDAYYILRQQCEQVFVCGMSMGGLLALLMSAEVSVDGVVVMAAPIVMHARPQNISFVRLLKYALRYTNQADASDLPDRIRAEQKRRGELPLGRVRYDQWSTAAYEQLLRLRKVVSAKLPQVSAPLLLIFSEKDRLISPQSPIIIRQQARSDTVETHLLKESGHVLTQDTEMMTVFQLATNFIVRHANQTLSPVPEHIPNG